MKPELIFYVPLIARGIPLAHLEFLQSKTASILSLQTRKSLNSFDCNTSSKEQTSKLKEKSNF
jgi:hypothetical protein